MIGKGGFFWCGEIGFGVSFFAWSDLTQRCERASVSQSVAIVRKKCVEQCFAMFAKLSLFYLKPISTVFLLRDIFFDTREILNNPTHLVLSSNWTGRLFLLFLGNTLFFGEGGRKAFLRDKSFVSTSDHFGGEIRTVPRRRRRGRTYTGGKDLPPVKFRRHRHSLAK